MTMTNDRLLCQWMCTMALQLFPLQSRRGRRSRGAAWVLLVLLLFQASAAAAETARPVPVLTKPAPAAATSVLAGWSIGRAFGRVEIFLSNRARMLQKATIGIWMRLNLLVRKRTPSPF